MKEIYRKSVLEKMSSPEQLDKAITIISPSFWIAAAGIQAEDWKTIRKKVKIPTALPDG